MVRLEIIIRCETGTFASFFHCSLVPLLAPRLVGRFFVFRGVPTPFAVARCGVKTLNAPQRPFEKPILTRTQGFICRGPAFANPDRPSPWFVAR